MQKSYLNKIAKVNRINGILTGIIIGCIVGLVLMTLVIWSGEYTSFLLLSVVVWGAVMITSVLVNVFIAGSRTRGVRRRVAALQATSEVPFEDVTFRRVSDEVLVGRDWLIVQKGLDYCFWTRKILSGIEVSQKKQSSDDGVLLIRTKGHQTAEELPVTSAEKVRSVLAVWLEKDLESQS